MKAWMSSNFGKFETELLPLINVRIEFLAHLSRRLIGELIVYRSSRRPCVRPSVRASVRSHFQT